MDKALDNLSPHYEEMLITALGGDIPAGRLVTAEDAYVFPLIDVVVAENVQFAGVIKSPKVMGIKTTLAITAGQALYYDGVNHEVTTVASTHMLVGFANKPALQNDTHIEMRFDGTLPFTKA